VSDHHYHYDYADARHDHRGEYADERHDHDNDYAEKFHRHYDDESTARGLREDLGRAEGRLRELQDEIDGALREELTAALERIRVLEQQTPHARQLQYEADQAAADLAASGYDERGEPFGADRHGPGCLCPYCPPEEDDPSLEVDDDGVMRDYCRGLP
jgi:hypothetical protein